jgi:hypothetical protein
MLKSSYSEVKEVNQECNGMCLSWAPERRHLSFATHHRHALHSRSSELGTSPKLEKRKDVRLVTGS